MTAPESKWVAEAMEQAQAYASTWSLIGGRFDDGSLLEFATEEKSMLRAHLQRQADLMERMGEALGKMMEGSRQISGAFGTVWGSIRMPSEQALNSAQAALTAFQESKQ